MHDFMHNSFFQTRKWDQPLGTFFGTVCFGLSGKWWRDEHFEHHAFDNTYVKGPKGGAAYPQMKEMIWVQHNDLFQFRKGWISNFLVRFQHWLFVPVNMFVAGIFINLDSWKEETRVDQWAALAVHWAWIIPLLMNFPTWQYAIWWIYGATCGEGILHLQLLVSHYDKPFANKHDTKIHSHLRRQAAACKDIINPWYMDWFHGGLNFHLVHHVWPKLPRNRYIEADKHLRALCKKHDIKVDRKHWFEAQWDIIEHLRKCSDHYVYELSIGGPSS